MDRDIAERIAAALEQIALELAEGNARPELAKAISAVPISVAQAGGFPPIGWVCPEHGSSKVVPAGVSARTGKPYDAFVACGERGCDRKPPRAVPARAAAPSQLP